MMQYAHPEIDKSEIYCDFYGLSPKDLGLYALVDSKIAGAIWCRKLSSDKEASAYVDDACAIVSMALLPEYRGKGIGSAMMEQFLQEAAASFDALSVDSYDVARYRDFFQKYGFSSLKERPNILYKELEKKEIVRPSDGYDPRKWMD